MSTETGEVHIVLCGGVATWNLAARFGRLADVSAPDRARPALDFVDAAAGGAARARVPGLAGVLLGLGAAGDAVLAAVGPGFAAYLPGLARLAHR